MASLQWETVLIDWVNCLKLCKPVNNLDELRDGEFFKHLRKLIKKSTTPIPDDDLTAIFDLLTQHYPGVKFSEKDSVHLKDMHPTDLVNLTSLMMHYTCIYDRRNALTSPMCYSLNLATQLYIKVFLELISSETTNNDLAGVIQDICTENNTTLGGTPVIRNQSPLQALLKTPASKNVKLIEKSREIERLKLELESEKADRNDCEFELAHFKGKVTELEGHLKQKNSEIKRLRTEVETLKMRTPPEFQDVPARESHKLLQKEIENLEEYIQKCEQEQDALQKDKDTLKERARKLENDCTMWQQNFYEIEEKYQLTIEQLREFELKNDSLEEHCYELQALLSEYQGKKSLDDSMQLEIRRNRRSKGFECSQLDEDLAHSVVDMQLKEAQKMIEDLTQKLAQIQEEKSLLEKQLLQVVEEKTQLGETQTELQNTLTDKSTECDSLRVQISSLNNEIAELKDLLKISQQQEVASKQLISQQQEELATLSQNLQLCDSLRNDLEQVQEQLVQERTWVGQITLELQGIKSQNQCLEEKCEQRDLELSKYNVILDESDSKIKQLNSELLELQQSKLSVDTELKEQKNQCVNFQQIITDNCDKLTAQALLVDTLKLSLENCNQREVASQQLISKQKEELATVLQSLEQSKSLCDSLKKELEQKLHFELQLQQIQSDNRNLNAQLSKLTTDLDEKCCQLRQVHLELSNYSTKLQESIVKNNQLEEQLLTAESELKRQTDKVAELVTEYDGLKKALELSTNQETASRQLISQQQDELATLSQGLELSKLQLEQAKTDKESLMAKLDCATTDQQNVESQLKKLEERFEEVSESKLKVTQELRVVQTECECLRNEFRKYKEGSELVVKALKLDNVRFSELIESKTAVLLQAEQKLEEEKEKCGKLARKLEESNAKMNQLETEIDSLKDSLEHSNQQETVSRQLVKQQQEELTTLSRNLELSKTLNEQLECDLLKEKEQVRRIELEVSKLTTDLEDKCCQLNQVHFELLTVDTKLKERTEQVDKLQQENDSLKQSLEHSKVTMQLVSQQQEELTGNLELSKSLNVELSERVHQTELQLEETKNDKQNLEVQVSKLTTQLECQKLQLEDLKECQESVKQLEELALSKDNEVEVVKGELQKVSESNQTLTKQLNQAMQDLEEFTQQQKILQTELQESKQDVNNLQRELQTLLKQLEATKLSLNNTEENAKSLKLEKESVNFYLKDTSKQLDKVEGKLGETQNQLQVQIKNLKDAKKETTKLEKRVEELEGECTNLRGEIEALKTKLREMENSKHIVQNNLDEALLKLEILKRDLITKESELEATKVSLTHANSEKDHFARLVEKLEGQLTKLQKVETEKQVLVQSHNETLTELERTKKDFDKSQKATRVVQNFLDLNTNELLKVSQEKEQLLEALEMSNRDKLDLEEENKSYSVELEKLRQELQLKDCELAELNLNLEQIQQVKEEKFKLVEQLQEQLNSREGELETVQQNANTFMKEKLDILEELRKVTREKEEKQSDDKNKLLQDKAEILENLQKVIKEKEELFFELGNISSQLEATKKENLAIMSDYQDLQNGHKQLLLQKRELEENLEVVKQQLEMSEKDQKDLENKNKKLQLEKDDVSKEKNDIYDYLQRSVEDKERTTLERDRLQCECNELKRERDAIFERLQTTVEECQKMALALELSEKETAKVKKERNEILHSQTEIMKDTEHRIVRAHEAAVEERRELLNRVEVTEKERDKLRQAYSSSMATNSKLDLENSTLKKLLEERNHDLTKTSGLKEAYEKLLDDNCRYSKEIEILKQKRSRDREEFLTLLKKEQEKGKKVDQVRAEYEDKLDKMKERMLKLYREEVQKEMEKVKSEQAGEVAYLQKVNDDLRSELWEVERKAKTLEKECNALKQTDRHCSSREIHSNPDQKSVKHMGTSSLRGRSNKIADRNSIMAASCHSLVSRQSYALSKEMVESLPKVRSTSQLYGRESSTFRQDRKLSTLPNRLQHGDYVEETVTVSRRTSINSLGRNFEMEDEDDDMFNNKYLTDLKEGRCQLPAGGQESNANRVSELAWRNSMVPPHLKSSYPAELQFVSPTRFNEEDIKTGNVMDDSQCKLLPSDKQRPPKKDFGTTSYKKPGPPTPSKNGGRLSLQGGDVLPLREHNTGRTSTTPKKGTPSRLRALFKGMRDGGAHQRENIENLTPRESRRFSLWNRK